MGSYAESLLTPDEKVLRRERQHWLALILDSWLAMALWSVTIILIVVRMFLPEDVFGYDLFSGTTWFGTVGTWLGLITLVAGIVVLAIRWWWWRTQEFLVTNRRLVLSWGILSKSASDSSLEKINDAQLDISMLGRILDYGHLKVLTAAPLQGADYLDRLNHAKAFKKAMMTAKHDLQSTERGDGEGYAVAAPPAVPASRSAARTPAEASREASADESPTRDPVPAKIDVSGGADPLKADTPEEVAAVLAQLSRLRDDGHISGGEYEIKKRELLDRL
ncbi:MAG: PH domain-containing protein [Chloroflexota bacterium]